MEERTCSWRRVREKKGKNGDNVTIRRCARFTKRKNVRGKTCIGKRGREGNKLPFFQTKPRWRRTGRLGRSVRQRGKKEKSGAEFLKEGGGKGGALSVLQLAGDGTPIPWPGRRKKGEDREIW